MKKQLFGNDVITFVIERQFSQAGPIKL